MKNATFEHAIKTIGLPIVKFKNNGKIWNFLADTGASGSLIDKTCLDEFQYNGVLEESSTISGLEGKSIEVQECELTLEDSDGKEYKDIFSIQDMSVAFGKMFAESHITIHGIIGSSFFRKYNVILDYSKNTIYQNNVKQVLILDATSGKHILTDLPGTDMSKYEIEEFIRHYTGSDTLKQYLYISGKIEDFKL